MAVSETLPQTGELNITHGGRSWKVALAEGVSTIGRYAEGSRNTIDLAPTDLAISRRHAEIERIGDAYELRNASGNGTYLNGQRVEQAKLEPGDCIRIGSAELRFSLAAPQATGERKAGVKLGRASVPEEGLTAPLKRPASAASMAGNGAAAGAPSIPSVVAAVEPPRPSRGASLPETTNGDEGEQASAGYSIDTGRRVSARGKGKGKDKAKEEKQGVSPVILLSAVGAVVVLLLVIVIGPSRKAAFEATAAEHKKVVADYEAYLKKAKKPDAEIKVRAGEVRGRLEAIAWAERVGRKDTIRRELNVLLMMDEDRTSPVYLFAVKNLARLR
jgi:pSer/pThr/pTyr-binding forkhead associated (FHA) protein